MHNFQITLYVPQNGVLIVTAHGRCWVGVLWACLSTNAGNSQWRCWVPSRTSLAPALVNNTNFGRILHHIPRNCIALYKSRWFFTPSCNLRPLHGLYIAETCMSSNVIEAGRRATSVPGPDLQLFWRYCRKTRPTEIAGFTHLSLI